MILSATYSIVLGALFVLGSIGVPIPI